MNLSERSELVGLDSQSMTKVRSFASAKRAASSQRPLQLRLVLCTASATWDGTSWERPVQSGLWADVTLHITM